MLYRNGDSGLVLALHDCIFLTPIFGNFDCLLGRGGVIGAMMVVVVVVGQSELCFYEMGKFRIALSESTTR